MYLKHYNLKTKPFEITTDPEFLWYGEKHKEAFAVLRYGVLENKGLLLLTGDVGVGKTTLITALVEEFADDIIHTTIFDPGVTVMDFYRYLAHGFGLDTSFSTKAGFLTLFRAFLSECFARGKKVLLIIDEAQRMEQKLLEEVRLLSNMEKNGTKLINVFFVGQTEFLEMLQDDRLRALRQRITLSYTIEPLDADETYRYIAARLKKAGADSNCFTEAAIAEIHDYSGGAPRMINIICDMAMVVGYSKGVTRIEKQTVRDGARKVPGVTVPRKKRSKDYASISQPLSQESVKAPFDQEKTENAVTPGMALPKSSPAYLFLLICLAVTLLFAAGMSWFHTPGIEKVLSSPDTVDVKDEPPALPSAQEVAPLTYPVTLYFRDSGRVMARRSVPLVQAVASSLMQARETLVLIRGFAAGMGGATANLKMSREKAEFVKNRLIAAGVSGERIRIFALGAVKEQPQDEGEQGSSGRVFVEIDVVE